MIPYKFTYLFITLVSLIPWSLFYYFRKDLRRGILKASLIVAVLSFVGGYFLWAKDWWHPATITGTRVGIEDIILGFTNGGLAAVLYLEFFHKMFYRPKKKLRELSVWYLLAFMAFLIFVLWHFFHYTSFIVVSVSFIVTTLVVLTIRHDLIWDSIVTGIICFVGSIPFYYLAMVVSPGWIMVTWDKHLSGIRFTGIPIEDLIFYFFMGFFLGPLYLYWVGKRIRKMPKSTKRHLRAVL